MNQLKKEKLYQKWFKVMDFQFLKKKKKENQQLRERKRTEKTASQIC